ncbi:glycosyltransferase [Nocardioides pacificus]
MTTSTSGEARSAAAGFPPPPETPPPETPPPETPPETDSSDLADQEQLLAPALVEGPEEAERMLALLLELELVGPGDVAMARRQNSRTGEHVGDILVAYGALDEDDLVAVLADRSGLDRVSLDGFVPDLEIARRLPATTAQALRCVPVGEADGLLFVAVARPLDPMPLAYLEDVVGLPVRQVMANRSEIDQVLQRVHADVWSHAAVSSLMESRPDDSAHVVISPAQKISFITLAVAVLVCAVIWPMGTAIGFIAVCSAFYLAASSYKLRLTLRALGTHFETDVTDADLAGLDERALPTYTILVPLYREAGIVPRLVRGINALDYPRTKLDVKLLCEEDDPETVETIRDLDLPPHFHLVVVPDSQPRTKPKACNYGLFLAEGRFCVIFDAEDRPDPDQLKKAVIAFDRAGPEVACVQAKLNYFNQDQNQLTAWFANEYSMHFELVLPAMAADRVPIPLGGTSNHFITERLRELGGWDPFNVTEDADLGMRLHREGYRTAMIDSTTLEEANSSLPNWIRQRSRWIKGYLQTWLVHMRHPLTLLGQLGPKDFLSFNLTMGSAFLLLINPIFWALTTLYVFTEADLIRQLFPNFVFYVAASMLFIGNFVFVYLNVAGSLQRGQFGLTRHALLSPLYWGLMSWAAWKGFAQLFTNPFFWEKTEHGLDEAKP